MRFSLPISYYQVYNPAHSMERDNHIDLTKYYTPQESDRLDAFARMTDQIHHIPRQLQALPPGWRLMYPDGTKRNEGRAFEVTHRHVGILARTAWHLYQTEFANDPLLKRTADIIVEQVKAKYEAAEQREPHQPSDLWNNS